jgi:hypothetical protein
MLIHEPVENPSPSHTGLIGFGLAKRKNAAGEFVPKEAYCTFRTSFGGFSSCPSALDPAG